LSDCNCKAVLVLEPDSDKIVYESENMAEIMFAI